MMNLLIFFRSVSPGEAGERSAPETQGNGGN